MNGRHSLRGTVHSRCSGSHQFARTNRYHTFWRSVRELAGASAPKSLEQGPAPQGLGNGSSLNNPTLSWKILLSEMRRMPCWMTQKGFWIHEPHVLQLRSLCGRSCDPAQSDNCTCTSD